MSKTELKPAEALFNIVIFLNFLLRKSLPFIDLSAKTILPGTITQLLLDNRDLIFEVVKRNPFDNALSQSEMRSGQFELRLNRVKATKFANTGKVDTEGRWSVFSQAFRQIHVMKPASLRRGDKLYTVMLLGERAQDAGGPYRESFEIYAQELQSKSLPLLIRTVNGRQAVGYNRDKWILNPSATTDTHLEMFAFLGKLMGIAIRSKEYLALNIPSIVW